MKSYMLACVCLFSAEVAFCGNLIKNSHYAEESCDMMELNHFYDCKGCHVFSQVIFWERNPANGKYNVRAWVLVEMRESLNRIPVKNEIDGLWHCDWFDSDKGILRKIKSGIYRESWTQSDPEKENKKVLPEKYRLALIDPRIQREQDRILPQKCPFEDKK